MFGRMAFQVGHIQCCLNDIIAKSRTERASITFHWDDWEFEGEFVLVDEGRASLGIIGYFTEISTI